MKDYERIDYLIRVLEGNNARAFASKAGIRTDTLSRARNGLTRASLVYTKILSAYPRVRREWLVDGDGFPFVEDEEKGEVLNKIEDMEKELRRLAKVIESLIKSVSPTGLK
jgi:hypothetical protein